MLVAAGTMTLVEKYRCKFNTDEWLETFLSGREHLVAGFDFLPRRSLLARP